MTEQFLRKAIFIDFGAEIIYGSDEFFDTYPCRFQTVEFMLSSTDALVEIADRIRMGKGYIPMHPRKGRTDAVDTDGWYDFYIGISKLPNDADVHLDNCITFVVVNSDSEDNEELYEIKLTDDEQAAVLAILDRQCKKHLRKSCQDLLTESEKEMMDEP